MSHTSDQVRASGRDPGPQHGGGATGTLDRPPARRGRRLRLDGWPPFGWRGGDGGGRGGGGGGGGDDDEGPFDPWRGLPRPGTGELGFALAMIAICTLFLIFLGAWFLLRKNAPAWPPPDAPGPPVGLWVSSLLLLGASATLARALAAHRRVQRATLLRCLVGTAALGIGFVGLQAWLWRGLVQDGLVPSTNGYGAIFYALTGLHAAHILGGLALLGRAVRSVVRAREGVGAEFPVRACGTYWHLMGALWIVIFGALMLP